MNSYTTPEVQATLEELRLYINNNRVHATITVYGQQVSGELAAITEKQVKILATDDVEPDLFNRSDITGITHDFARTREFVR